MIPLSRWLDHQIWLCRKVLREGLAAQITAKNAALLAAGLAWQVPEVEVTNIKIASQLQQLPKLTTPEIRIAPSMGTLTPSGNFGEGFLGGNLFVGLYVGGAAALSAAELEAEEVLLLQLLALEHCAALALRVTGGTALKGVAGINGVEIYPMPHQSHTLATVDTVTSAMGVLRVVINGDAKY